MWSPACRQALPSAHVPDTFQGWVTATCAHGHPRAPTRPLGLTTAVLSSCPQALAVLFRRVPALPPTTQAFLRLHQRFHHQGHLSGREPGHPHPSPPSGEERGTFSMDHTLHPVSEDSLSRVPPTSDLMTLQVPFTAASWATRDHTRRG